MIDPYNIGYHPPISLMPGAEIKMICPAENINPMTPSIEIIVGRLPSSADIGFKYSKIQSFKN